MMTKRKRTRTQDRADRIQAERAFSAAYNAARDAEQTEPPPF
jgi:hypothetical protein